MKNKIISFILILVSCLAFAGGKKDSDSKEEKPVVPVWMTDAGRISIFPDQQYISAFAFGGNAETAKNKAAETLSEYIKSHVTSSVNYSLNNEDTSVSQNSTVQTDNLLFNTEYTTPFYSDSYGMFGVVAYIDRAKAFNYVKPKLDSAARTFPKEYEQALLVEDDFEKVLAITKSRESLVSFYEVYDFARAIKPDSASQYEQVNILSEQSLAMLNQTKKNVTVSVKFENDSEGRFKSALSSLFTELGFTVTEKSPKYECKGIANFEGQQKTSQTHEIYPSYSVEVIKDGNTKFSAERKLPKTAGFDQATAERRSKLAVEDDIKNNLRSKL